MKVDIEDLRTNSLSWLEKDEMEYHNLSSKARRKEMERYNEQVSLYDADLKWALYCFPNKIEYIRRTIKFMELITDDILLDIGAGDGRLSLMALQENKIKEAIAIEWCDKWVNATMKYINDNYEGLPDNMTYQAIPYQDFEFPINITKCVFLAHHNSNITKLNILKKLSRTDCKLFVHNFGKQGSIEGEILR